MPTDVSKVHDISDADAERRIEIAARWKRYEGDHPAALKVAPGETDDNTSMPDAGTIVDAGVDFLVGIEPGMHALDEDGEEHEDGTIVLDRIWKAAHRATFLRELAQSASIAGHFAVKILPGDGDDGLPGIVMVDPCDLQIRTDAADIRKRTGYIIDQKVGEDNGSTMLLREEHELDEGGASWTIRYYRGRTVAYQRGMSTATGIRWELTDTKTWPHPFPAIVDGQNLPAPHQVWGRSDLSPDVILLQDAINASVTGERRILRHHAHPQEVVTGSDQKAAQKALQQAAIGAALILPENGTYSLVQASTGGLDASTRFRESLTDKMFERAGVPRIAVGEMEGVGALSGVAMLVMYRPLMAKTETKRATIGDVLCELNRRLLVLAGIVVAECGITWADPLPKDSQAAVSEALDLQTLGVSRQTIFERLGLNWDLEQRRLADEQGDPMGDAHGALARIDELQAELDALTGVGAPPAVPQDDTEAA